MLDLDPRPLPLLTHDLLGTGGVAKMTPEDFVVEELPAYLPSGEGQHLYVLIEKRDLTTQEAVALVARAAGVSEKNVGYAGQKDRAAVTRQWLSVASPLTAIAVEDERLVILSTSRHNNKLRLGHTRGNRFILRLRGVVPDSEARAQAIFARLATTGLPNFYGAQRFGHHGDNAALGAALLGLGEHRDFRRADRDRQLFRLVISALQSELFNRIVTARIADGLWEQVIPGDVLQKRGGGLFSTTDIAIDQERLVRHEVDITAPMPGPNERPEARDEARAREDRVLAECGIPREAFGRSRGQAEGARRASRVVIQDPAARLIEPDVLELTFALPPGAYATRVIAEVTHS
jgi:tRNA pseudouridine13 synthase